MPGTLFPSASAMLSAGIESLSCVGSPETGNRLKNNKLHQQNQPTGPHSRSTSRTYNAAQKIVPEEFGIRDLSSGTATGGPW